MPKAKDKHVRIKSSVQFCSSDEESQPSENILTATQDLIISYEQLQELKECFLDNVNRGLMKASNPKAAVKCFPTYVQELPDGTERGAYLSLEFGGSTFRIIEMIILEDYFLQESKIYKLTQEHMTGTGEYLFDFIADCLSEFVIENDLTKDVVPLAINLGFPCIQKGLTVALLRRWTKGFTCQGVIGKDVVKLLNEGIARKNKLKIKIVAVTNDTVGTLVGCAFKNKNARIGCIIDIGTNTCYIESQKNVQLFDAPDTGSGKVIINVESGAFGDDGSLDVIRTEFDKLVDEHSTYPGAQISEKMISGMYLGELVRFALEKFTNDGIMFGGRGSNLLSKAGSFPIEFVSAIETDSPNTFSNTRDVCAQLGLNHATDEDCINLRYICLSFSLRAAYLMSAKLSVLLEKVNEKYCIIGIDGIVYKSLPRFREMMIRRMRELTDPNIKFDIMLSEDGGGTGSAMVAAVQERVSKRARQRELQR